MENNIKLLVYRRQDEVGLGLASDSEMALQLHNARRAALHEVFEQQTLADVIDWGQTDDKNTHECVTLLLSAIGVTVIQKVFTEGIKELAKKLAEKAIDETTSEFVKWVIAKLIKKQKEQKIRDFTITLKDGTTMHVDTPQGTSQITINFSDGGVSSIVYNAEDK